MTEYILIYGYKSMICVSTLIVYSIHLGKYVLIYMLSISNFFFYSNNLLGILFIVVVTNHTIYIDV
jgi:hypothetical protein